MQIEYDNTIIDVKKGTKVLDLFSQEINNKNNKVSRGTLS